MRSARLGDEVRSARRSNTHSSFRRTPESSKLCFLDVLVRKRCLVPKHPCVYILASGRNGTLYVGVTSDLVKRVWQHRNNAVEGFTNRYDVHSLVWFEPHATMESAIAREKAIKEWKRRWKLDMIERQNPEWRDLYADIV